MNKTTRKDVIKDWWAKSPMTYGDVHGQAVYKTEKGTTETLQFGTCDFFERVDRTFYSWNPEFHTETAFFGAIFPYDRYKGKSVLEIGCGLGTMAMNWAQHGAHVTAVDLNPVSVAQTTQRFKLLGLNGNIAQMDANELSFADNFFDYVYSWGVLHHSPDLERSVHELFRVLRPGAEFGVMLYSRDSMFYRYLIRYLEGYLHAESRFLNPLELASRYTDGAEQEGNPHTWPVTRREAHTMFSVYSDDATVQPFGPAEYAFPPKIPDYLPALLKRTWARRWAWSLWISGTKR
jgi:ubiquinone/menaquinone biosynthesis C-methylase UbiE